MLFDQPVNAYPADAPVDDSEFVGHGETESGRICSEF
jgi:hypothetical protein